MSFQFQVEQFFTVFGPFLGIIFCNNSTLKALEGPVSRFLCLRHMHAKIVARQSMDLNMRQNAREKNCQKTTLHETLKTNSTLLNV